MENRENFQLDADMENVMKTFKYLICAASVALLASVAGGPVLAANTIDSTPHNLANLTTAPSTAQICVFCHTPHNGNTNLPLWNRNAPTTATFTLYADPAGTIDGTIGQPTGVSLGCLSCHDGATALNSLVNTAEVTAFNAVLITSPFTMGDIVTPVNPNSVLGSSLANDHPVSIQYGTVSGDTAFNTVASVGTGGLTLYGAAGAETVECGSCHNPHDNDQVTANASKFLRKSNASSALCTTCHVK